MTFQVPAGKLTALVGPSGAGKTTITHLVPRLYDPVRGTVRIGGHDVRDLTLESLRSVVGVVPQDAHLFHDTIRANLLYARPSATEKELTEACRAARIWELISSLPDGLDTIAGDRGYRFSGGEKQRLALARLLLKAPSVVVLDEATAHLDSESEAAIQRALATALAGRTSLVIAHRLSTVRAADQILVVDGGQITERGTHDELLAAGGVYAGLYRTQFASQAALPAAPRQAHQLRLARPSRSTQMTPRRRTKAISTASQERQRTTVPRPCSYTASSATTLAAPQLAQVATAMVISAPNTSISSPPIASSTRPGPRRPGSRRPEPSHPSLLPPHRPLAPNRSVLTRTGGYPRSTRPAATVSTKLVGPHTYASGLPAPSPGAAGQATSASIRLSTRRA